MDTYFISLRLIDRPIPRQFKTLGEELARRGHRVVFLVDHHEDKKPQVDQNPVVYPWPSDRPTRFQDAVFLFNLVRKYKPACLITGFGATNLMILIGWLLQVTHRIVWYHTVSTESKMGKSTNPFLIRLKLFRKKWVYSLATGIVAVSDATKLDVRQTFSIPENKIRVFRYALQDPVERFDTSLFTKDESQKKIVCVGRVIPIKGQDILIQAIAQMNMSTVVEFIGDGFSLEDYQQLAQSLGVQDRCSFLGSVPNADVYRKMYEADLVVVPSRDDAFPLVVLEALAMGKPVIASRVGGIPEAFRDGVAGYLVSPEDPAELASRIEEVLSSSELTKQMGKKARERFLEEFEYVRNIRSQADWLEYLILIK